MRRLAGEMGLSIWKGSGATTTAVWLDWIYPSSYIIVFRVESSRVASNLSKSIIILGADGKKGMKEQQLQSQCNQWSQSNERKR